MEKVTLAKGEDMEKTGLLYIKQMRREEAINPTD